MERCAVCQQPTPSAGTRCEVCGEPLRKAGDKRAATLVEDSDDERERERDDHDHDHAPQQEEAVLQPLELLPVETIHAWRLRTHLHIRLLFDSPAKRAALELDRVVLLSRGRGQTVAVDAVQDGCLVAQQLRQIVMAFWQACKAHPPPTFADDPLGHVAEYARSRLPTLHAHCALCDQRHPWAGMINPSVCQRDLCSHQFASFGKRICGAVESATGGEVLDLLIATTRLAALSERKKDIFTPFPSVPDPDRPSRMALDPLNPDYGVAARVLEGFPTIDGSNSATDYRSQLRTMGPLCAGMYEWIVSSNCAHIVSLPAALRIAEVGTPHQFVMLSAPPERQKAFDVLKRKYGTQFIWHGSSCENWHAILRTGLKNCSGTKLMTAGAAAGPGIYMCTSHQTSMGFSQRRAMVRGSTSSTGVRFKGKAPPPMRQEARDRIAAAAKARQDAETAMRDTELRGATMGGPGPGTLLRQGEDLVLIALCEVALAPSVRGRDNGGSVWVAPDQDCVVTRFLFAFSRHQEDSSTLQHGCHAARMPADTTAPEFEASVRDCIAKLQEHCGR